MTDRSPVTVEDRAAAELGLARPGLAFAVLAAIQLTLVASITMLSLALPAVQRELHAGLGDLALASSAYGLSFSGLLLIGRLTAVSGYVGPLLAGLLVLPAGACFAFAGATITAVSTAPGEQAGLVSGVLNAAMETGPTIGLAALVSIAGARAVSASTVHQAQAAAAYGLAFTVATAAVAAVAVIAAVALRPPAGRPRRPLSRRGRDRTPRHPSDGTPSGQISGRKMMTARFSGKVALVTGGGSGIGREIALGLAREGAAVVVAGRTAPALEETVKLIEGAASEGKASWVTADIRIAGDVARLVRETVARHGGLHVAVNNAGTIGASSPVADIDEAIWADVVTTNLTGTYLSMKYEIKHMRAHGGGTIVNVASNIGAHVRRPGMGAYAAAKAGVGVLTKTAARDHVKDGVRINAVSPGASDTPMSLRPGETAADRAARLADTVPIGRVGGLGEIASAVLWLASSESSFAVGHDLVVDGGATA